MLQDDVTAESLHGGFIFDAWRTQRTLADLLTFWATLQPARQAFLFLGPNNEEVESFTFSSLDRAARRLAVRLLEHANPGDRALLMFPSGLAFVLSFFACQYAGIIPVPVTPPRNKRLRDGTFAISRDCEPALALTSDELLRSVVHQFAEDACISGVKVLPIRIEDFDRGDADGAFARVAPEREAVAFLQYTSGSTSTPRGVRVSQGNILANLEMQRLALRNDMHATYVGWVPLYHDMGLIANVLEPFYLGGRSILMSPAQFAQYPWLWLRAISHYRADVSGGPNFAYDLCVSRARQILGESIDLSRWRIAFNSAEPVHASTVRRFGELFSPLGFRAEAMYPCYGLAEATLMVAGGKRAQVPHVVEASKAALATGAVQPPTSGSDAKLIVGCGEALQDEVIAIVNPETFKRCPQGRVGEVWVAGPHIPAAYWSSAHATIETFHARITGERDESRYLRTGDLGFMQDGELYITGRLKDLIIVRGRNIYPQDIERIAERSYPGLKPNAAAAFGLPDVGAESERVVLIQEIERESRKTLDVRAATTAVRLAIFDEFDFTLHAVVFVEPASVPRTSSGKIRRAEARRRFLAGELEGMHARALNACTGAQPRL